MTCFTADKGDDEEIFCQMTVLRHQLLSTEKLSAVMFNLLHFLHLKEHFSQLKLLTFIKLHRYQLSLLCIQFFIMIISSYCILFKLKRELLQFLFNDNKVWTVLKLVLLFHWQKLSQFRIVKQGHDTEQIINNNMWLVTEVAVLTVCFKVFECIEIIIHISASVFIMLYSLS